MAVVFAIAGTSVAAGSPALGEDGPRFRTLDVPGAANTFLYDVNSRGEAAGQGFDASFAMSTAAVLGPEGAFTYVVPGAIDTSFGSINNEGLVAGEYTNGNGVGVVFTLRRGGVRSPDFVATPTAAVTTAGLNDEGDFAGLYTVDFATIHGFTRIDGVVNPFDYPSPSVTITQAFKLTNRRDVVGWYRDATGSHGFVRTRTGSFIPLNVPGAYLTRAFGINNRGVVIGYSQAVKGGPATGFVWSEGHFRTVSYPGVVDTVPQGINDRGDIVGYYTNSFSDGPYHGFMFERGEQGARSGDQSGNQTGDQSPGSDHRSNPSGNGPRVPRSPEAG